MINRSDKDLELYLIWKKSPNPMTLRDLLKQLEPILVSEVNKQIGSLPRQILMARAKEIVIESLPKFDSKFNVKLSTFVINQLKQLKRLNYEHQNIVRMPENRQLRVKTFIDAKENLQNTLQREANTEELADHLSWPIKEVQRMERDFHTEAFESSAVYDPIERHYSDELNVKVEYALHSLAPRDRLIFELATGYKGKKRLSNNEIAKQLSVTPAMISQRKLYIAQRLKQAGV